jgi:hypothetical protein
VPPYSPVEVASSSFNAQSEPGAGFGVGGTPNASVTPAGGTAVGAGFGVSVYPLYINISGESRDSSGDYNMYVGQQCIASISNIPQNSSVTYNWTVTGATFQAWSDATPQIGSTPANPSASYLQTGSGPLNVAGPSWYWNDSTNTPETITCTAIVTQPSPFQTPITLNLKATVNVWLPKWSATCTLGNLFVENDGTSSNPDFELEADGTPTNTQGGMVIIATGSSPNSNLPSNLGAAIYQLVTPNVTEVSQLAAGGPTETDVDNKNGQTGLDTNRPYGWFQTPTATSPYFWARDSPHTSLTANNALSINDGTQFVDYLMFLPPAPAGASATFVPMGRVTWGISTGGTIPTPALSSPLDWPTGIAGSLTGGGSFAPCHTFPSWTQILGSNVEGMVPAT